MKICDLHTHSIYSDGTYTPQEIINEAVEKGLSAVALCDHNTVDGLAEFLSAAEGRDIEAVAGAEFSVDYNGKELHLLGLFIPSEHFAEVSVLMGEYIKRKDKSNADLINALNKAGYNIDYEKIKKSTPNGKFNRVHIAAELTAMGYTQSIKEAFDRLLAPTGDFYTEPQRTSIWDMLDFIKSIGAVSVLAHPFLNISEEEIEALLPAAKEKGLVGMECYYSRYSEETTQKALALADRYGLEYSGGSDFHGSKKPDIALGSGMGNLAVPYSWAEMLKKKAKITL